MQSAAASTKMIILQWVKIKEEKKKKNEGK